MTQRYATQLRERGYRVTPQRQLILETLGDIGGHATVTEIYERVQEKSWAVDRATVYRTVKLFCEIGLVGSAEIHGQTLYELTDSEPHHHLVCRGCGSVSVLADYHVHDLAHHLQKEHGFIAEMNHLTIFGRCADCSTN